MSQKDAYLDSSILLTKKFGTIAQKRNVIKKLVGRKKIATMYVKREIKRTFLNDAIWLHTILIEAHDIPPVFERIKGFNITPRRQKRCLAILQAISAGGLRYPSAVCRLENLILGLEKELLKDVKIIESGTNCHLAEEELEFYFPIFTLNISCTREKAHCCLPAYLSDNLEALRALESAIAGIDNLEGLRKALNIILKDTEKAKGNYCKTLGDTVICLDAPQNCDVLSTNEKDFKPICECLKKSFISAK